MDMKAGLFQHQTLKLNMTQELTQAIALLQYSTQELTAFLENKALENPLLHVEVPHVKSMDPRRDRIKKVSPSNRDQRNWMEQLSKPVSGLFDHLQSQLIQEHTKPLVINLIEYIDENGYLILDKEQILETLHATAEELEEAIAVIQCLDPSGIGAATLAECLYLQLIKIPKRNLLAEALVLHHFEDLANKKWKELAKKLAVPITDIQEAFDLIQTLNPRPASGFQREASPYVIPDVVVKWDGAHFEISVFDELLPKVSFQQSYYQQFENIDDKNLKKYLEQQRQDYYWILKSLEQRKETITKVALKIVEKQRDFFLMGPTHLKAMTMKEIAEETMMHESTVSRAVREKYMQTPFGTFELRTFFTSTVKAHSSDQASSSQVKKAIQQLIEKENKQKPYSDQEIVLLLEEKQGYILSRRTVAKYREQLGILSSSKRKRYDKGDQKSEN